jgi:hypothetical protein
VAGDLEGTGIHPIEHRVAGPGPLIDSAHDRSPYQSETERREALPPWLHTYNHHRGHTALKGLPPASRVPNLTGQNS